ncbi:antibiotic biosynthesis monooxygenase [Skermanella mucosa]|jgi:heme-degrading monooxygenase HmoA|uniref:antibiotic biosynthesis monooxygenase family protein n=1 Tax=Skermanella mucosa TaxID=1789672 RepID=UPI00192AC0F2|nr:antibiotic biosynthesis monooxygenase family protein [Skermanella mucosa]UEM22287.1 antibiotic biosynthesis monooxygenase [Skermanella mucosa]
MITELALLRLLPGSAPAFESAFAGVAPLLAGADGCLRYRLVPTLDVPDVYLLEVVWRDLEAHTQGFEPSDAHARFMAPLKPMLLGEPIVVHISAGEPS